MSESGEGLSWVQEAVSGADNVLVLAPTMESGTDEVCTHLLSDPSGRERVLFVTLSDSPDDRLATWRAHADHPGPDEAGFIAVGDSMRSAAADATTADHPSTETTITTVSSPGDLTGLGIEASSFLSEWAEGGGSVRVCVHSLTTLLQYVDTQQVFRFLHVLTGRFESVGATAHYHLDPTAHDDQTINTLKSLFDAMVEFDGEEWDVTVR